MKQYELVEFLLNLNVKPPLHNREFPPHRHKTPCGQYSGDGSAWHPTCNTVRGFEYSVQ